MTEQEAKDLADKLNLLIEDLGYYASLYKEQQDRWSVEILNNWPVTPLPRQ
jgi:hypothetical protein